MSFRRQGGVQPAVAGRGGLRALYAPGLRAPHLLSAGLLAGALLVGQGGPAAAQDWATPEACAVPVINPAAPPPMPEGRDEVMAAASAIPNGQGRLWRVTAPDGKVSHLLGTLHASDRQVTALVGDLAPILADTKILILESDPVAKNRLVLEERNLQAGMWIAGTDKGDPKDWLTAPVRDWVEARLASQLGRDDGLAWLTDVGLATMMLNDPCEDFSAGVLPVVDSRLYLAAYEAGIGTVGLEDWDAFINDLSGDDRRDVARAVAASYGAYLDPYGFSEARVSSVALYLEGRIGEMMEWNRRFLLATFGEAEGARIIGLADGYLLDERNRRFARRLGPYLAEGGALVAVGAFHLPGEGGLVALLRAEGYRVERLPIGAEPGAAGQGG